jgi:hypothetical protein
MSERIWNDAEVAAFKAAESQLAERGMYITGPKGDKNAEVFMKFFTMQPGEPITVENLLRIFEGLKARNMVYFKSDAQLKFEKAAAHIAPEDLDTLERFLKANRLWPDQDSAYSNAVLFIGVMGGRPYTVDVLAHLALPLVRNSRGEGLRWKAPSQPSTYRNVGQHSGGDAHFAPRAESNQFFSHRVVNNSTEIPRPVSSSKMDEYQWNRMASALCGGRHSDTAAIQGAVKAAGGGQAGYEAGVKVQRQLRMERERGR